MSSEVRFIISFNRHDRSERIRLSKEDFFSYDILKSSLSKKLNISNVNSFEVEYFDNIQSCYVSANALKDDHFHLISKCARILIIETPHSDNDGIQPLRITGRLFPNINELYIASHQIKITEVENAKLGTGLITWDSSVYLAKYLELHKEIISGKNVLEIGAGTGVCGIACAYLGAQNVLLTDLEYVLHNLKSNVHLNFPETQVEVEVEVTIDEECIVDVENNNENIKCHYLDSSKPTPLTPSSSSSSSSRYISVNQLEWGNASTYQYPLNVFGSHDHNTDWDIVLGADIVWLENLIPLLIHALKALCSPKTLFILSYQKRSERTDKLLFQSLQETFTTIDKMPRDEGFPVELKEQNKIEIYHCHNRRQM